MDRDRTNLFLDGEQIGFDGTATQSEGWGWTDQTRTSIELYGAACSAFKTNPRTNVSVEFGCEQVAVSPQ